MGWEKSTRAVESHRERLDSLSLHLDFPAGAVVGVTEFVDETAGIPPVYQYQSADRVLVSTSVLSLVDALGDFRPDQQFLDAATPLTHDASLAGLSVMDVASLLPTSVKNTVKPLAEPMLNALGLLSTRGIWVSSTRTPDRRVRKVAPFERVTPTDRIRQFEPTYSMDPKDSVTRVARYVQQFIARVEEEYPDHHHVVLTGGKDSELIWLADKRDREKWHAASSPPNYSLNEEFLVTNDVPHSSLIELRERNTESAEETRRKILASDLRADIRHLRWRPQLETIANRFDRKVIFWSGTVGCTLHSYHPYYAGGDRAAFFEAQFTRSANFQATAHQTVKNYTGCAKLSPYHSPEIWENVYRHYDPSQIQTGADFRTEIGRELYGRPIEWPSTNPGPASYTYPRTLDPTELYLSFAQEMVNGRGDLDIFPG